MGCDPYHRGVIFARRLIVINRLVRLEFEGVGASFCRLITR